MRAKISGLLGAVGLQLRVPPPHVVLDRLGVEGEHVLHDPGRLGRGEPGRRDQVVDEVPIGWHVAHGPVIRARDATFCPISGKNRAILRSASTQMASDGNSW